MGPPPIVETGGERRHRSVGSDLAEAPQVDRVDRPLGGRGHPADVHEAGGGALAVRAPRLSAACEERDGPVRRALGDPDAGRAVSLAITGPVHVAPAVAD